MSGLKLGLVNDDSIETEQVWVWKTEAAEYYFDPGTTIRARIETEKWNGPNEMPVTAAHDNADTKARAQVPYSIEASIAEPGLGGVNWW